MIIEYTRVSSKDQNLDLKVPALKKQDVRKYSKKN
jgi:DNA invertase Pin-like site-specific DNA recombinase